MQTVDKITTPEEQAEVSVESEIDRIGRDFIKATVKVSSQQVSNMKARGRFPKAWYYDLVVGCEAAEISPPPLSVFGDPLPQAGERT